MSASAGGMWERPPNQRGKGNRQNLIFLNTDTFRADNLQAYGGNGLVRCPRLDKFAEDCVVFEDCYPEGMPTIPIRRVLMTGRRILPYHYFHQHEPVQTPGWHELYYEDQTIAETLHEAGYSTALFADIPHLQRPGKNFHRGYRYYEWTRGHEVDYYEQAPATLEDIVPTHYPQEFWDRWVEMNPGRPDFMRQFLANRKRYETECEAIIELTAKNVIHWLRRNHDKEPFFLHLEAFDPHEPWDPPKRFLDEYLPDATGPAWWEPPYASIEVPPEGRGLHRQGRGGRLLLRGIRGQRARRAQPRPGGRGAVLRQAAAGRCCGSHQGPAPAALRGARSAHQRGLARLRGSSQGERQYLHGAHVSRCQPRIPQRHDAALRQGCRRSGLAADAGLLRHSPALTAAAPILSNRTGVRSPWSTVFLKAKTSIPVLAHGVYGLLGLDPL